MLTSRNALKHIIMRDYQNALICSSSTSADVKAYSKAFSNIEIINAYVQGGGGACFLYSALDPRICEPALTSRAI